MEMKRKKNKTVADSLTEVTKLLQYKDINGYNRLFGGRLMEWIDEAAGIAAQRHCGGAITTASVDNLQFRHAAYLHDLVVIIAKVTYVGRTSMEVRVDSYAEDCKTGMRHLINHAYLTEVHVDSDGNPQPVEYGLELTNEVERAEWEGARKRIAFRKTRQTEGY
jgi:acyl-CoA hydrolase